MDSASASFRKSIIASAALGVATLVGTYAASGLMRDLYGVSLVMMVAVTGTVIGLALLLVAVGGMVASRRQAQIGRGDADLFVAANHPRSEWTMSRTASRDVGIPLSSIRRRLSDGHMLVGDMVRIRSYSEIKSTLDEDGRLDGMPFMPEMAKFCGRTGTVFRVVDKIYDYGGRKDLRRMRATVLLTGLRCDGSAHGGCQAGCYLLWRTDWLERMERQPISRMAAHAGCSSYESSGRDDSHARSAYAADHLEQLPYSCQFTELVTSSTPMKSWDPRQDVRPLIAGNVTLLAFVIALATRIFNAAQAARGGAGFPGLPSAVGSASNDPAPLNLRIGDFVRVASADRIQGTLDHNGKHKGLWFDRDMLKYCGHSFQVVRQIERIIDDRTGRMLRLKTPCFVLGSVCATGEFLRFCAQCDFVFWRESWLEKTSDQFAESDRK